MTNKQFWSAALLIIALGSVFFGLDPFGLWPTPKEVARAAIPRPPIRQVEVAFTSDPTGATVTIDGKRMGRTPLLLSVDADTVHSYTVTPDEPYSDYKLYVPYSNSFTTSEDTAISVWVNRTTQEEQAVARQRSEAAREAAARAACKAKSASAVIIIENWRWSRSRSGSYVVAEGRVTNNTSKTLRNIQALVEYETASGQFITSDYSTIDLRDLLPGQSSPFSVMTSYNPAMSKAFLRFREFFGGTIPAMNRKDVGC